MEGSEVGSDGNLKVDILGVGILGVDILGS